MTNLLIRPLRSPMGLITIGLIMFSSNCMAASTAYVRTTERLDLKRVQLTVMAPPEQQASLRLRALEHFHRAGLPAPDVDASEGPPLALLTLTLTPQLINSGCQGKILYAPSLTLTEPVTIPRSGSVVQDATWLFSHQTQVRDLVTSGQMEEDLDGLVAQFIADYTTVNTAKEHFRKHSPSQGGDTPPAPLPNTANDRRQHTGAEQIREVRLSVLAGQWSAVLKAHAVRQLAEGGIRHSSDPNDSGLVDLSLEMIQQPLDKDCPGQVLYEQGLYVVEEVQLVRRPDISYWSDTWQKHSAQIVSPRSLRDLEADQTLLLQTFFQASNPKK